MRSGFADGISIALIGLVSAIITVVFEKETNNSFTKIIYQDTNISICEKQQAPQYDKIIITDEYNKEWK